MSNHLVHESSPYLLQHAGNPVDWYPWEPQALEKAMQEDKPIFLSIGYAACHWCHVMAHESFENPDIADILNAHFVCIKVDREERPDLDSIYMSFVVAATGQGGWPMSVFLTPDGKPFYGGTYFPPLRRHNLPAFRDVIETVARLWRTDREGILTSSDNLLKGLSPVSAPSAESSPLSSVLLDQAVRTIGESYDRVNGGWGGAPKFPQPMLIEFLLRQASRGNHASRDMAVHTLHTMAQGGMYDVLGGGFSRYSVDPAWLVPHFEKMLYDNAQLALLYLHAYLLTGDPDFRQICESTLDFVLREMTHPEGGFFSSLDADSEGEEGKFYLWTAQELQAALSNNNEADLFMAAYGVSEAGNFEGRNILRRTLSNDQLAQRFNLEPISISSRLASLRRRLLDVRNHRVRPATDDKVLVSWNALMLASFAEAGASLGRVDYIAAAVKNASFILDHMDIQHRLMRSWRQGIAKQAAFLEDYAGLALALLKLYQSDPNPFWFQKSMDLFGHIRAHFIDPSGGFYDTSDDHEALLYRPKDLQDNATPSGSALAAMLALQFASYEGRSDWRKLAEDMLGTNLGMIQRYPSAFAQWLCAADFALGPSYEVAIIGDMDRLETKALVQPLWQGYYPRMVLAASPYPPAPGSPSLLNDRHLLNDKPTAFVCQGFVCHLPVNEPSSMLAQLSPGDSH